MIERRRRKSRFVKLFDKTPSDVECPHFYELVLSNGCPYNCTYCYLKLTFKGNTNPVLFSNDWTEVEKELEAVQYGVFSTGELADSLAIEPPLLEDALSYFSSQRSRFMLLLTKSTNIQPLLRRKPSDSIIVSFSVNSASAHAKWENSTPSPTERLEAAKKLKSEGWRVRIRIDPIVIDDCFSQYESVCKIVNELNPERVTIGTLRHYRGLFNFSPEAPQKGLIHCPDGRMRYPLSTRVSAYRQVKDWLGIQPALCKETKAVWRRLGWNFLGCNCTE